MIIRIALMLLMLCSAAGCLAVRATERENLADPTIVPEVERDTERFRGHVQEVREASRGGLGLEGAGCGCN